MDSPRDVSHALRAAQVVEGPAAPAQAQAAGGSGSDLDQAYASDTGPTGPQSDHEQLFKRLFTISEFYDRDRTAYYQALQSVRERGMGLTGWLEYFAEGLSTQMREVQERGERSIRRDVLARKHRLSDRQAAALGYAIEHGGLTIQNFVALFPKVTRRTLQREIKDIIDAGLLVPEGATNRRHYRLTLPTS